MITEFKTNKKIVANNDCVSLNNFVLSKGVEVKMVVHDFFIDKISLLFNITDTIGGNVMVERDYISRNFDDVEKE